MDILNCQEAFGAADMTSKAMQKAIKEWFSLYYRNTVTNGEDPCQRIAYTVISKLVRTAFAEYTATTEGDFTRQVLQALKDRKELALQLAMVGGECYIKPWPEKTGFGFTLIPRDQILIFGRDPNGAPTDVGTAERSSLGSAWYTLLERRRVDDKGFLTVENQLYRSYAADQLGQTVPLHSHPLYAGLQERYTYETPADSVGLVRLHCPVLNCVDGSKEGCSVLAPVTGLIHNIDRNAYLLSREFENGRSRVLASADLLAVPQQVCRVLASADLLRDGQLEDELFVGLDEDPQTLGITLFSPELRDKSFLSRKQEYLRNIESVVGLKRGLLSDANLSERTATEISASQSEHAMTVLDFQRAWEQAVQQTVSLCAWLGKCYGIGGAKADAVRFDWGNGSVLDESAVWEDYKDMVSRGMLRPEVALGWRFGMEAETNEQQQALRQKFMPEK